eukprot:TRINITY_DN1809_c0_g2_i5.p1 TRINITY_DN1809_c0_g2~~TRINITY_DN1809_c0_g2_i5.p1  ORF type:complete len:344 (+),score=49.98 TRINITY_DN1809_c0_g2_i5:4-1035(+)
MQCLTRRWGFGSKQFRKFRFCPSTLLAPNYRKLPAVIQRASSYNRSRILNNQLFCKSKVLTEVHGVKTSKMAPAKQAKQVVEELGQKIIQLELLPGKDKIASKQGITVFENIQENVTYNQEYSSPDTGIVLGVKDTQQEPTYCKDFVIGKLKCKRLLVCARCKLFWMTPEWTQYPQGIPPDTQFMLVELQDEDCYAIILPLIDNAFRCTLRPSNGRGLFNNGTNNGAIRSKYDLILRVDSGDKTVKGNTFSRALFVGAGRDPFELVERGMSAAAYLSGGAKPLKEKALPDTLDYFGWCTWDAFYSTVSAQGVIEGLNTLKEGGTPPKFIIIDDGWQQTKLSPR